LFEPRLLQDYTDYQDEKTENYPPFQKNLYPELNSEQDNSELKS